MPTRVCLECGGLTSKASQRGLCPDCQREYEQDRPARIVYDSPEWRRLSRSTIQAWVARYGWQCPGWQVPAHPSRDLTLDHGRALTTGGAPFDPRNTGVLCRACNGRKGATSPATQKEPHK
jgi:5-methylcytosine-specific restriction protein A